MIYFFTCFKCQEKAQAIETDNKAFLSAKNDAIEETNKKLMQQIFCNGSIVKVK